MGPVEKNLREHKRLVDEEVTVLETFCETLNAYSTLPLAVRIAIFEGLLQRRALSRILDKEIRDVTRDSY